MHACDFAISILLEVKESQLSVPQLRTDKLCRGRNTANEETRSERDTCTPMFIAALFIIARTWKQPRCPSADEWKAVVHIHHGILLSLKKNAFEAFLMRWMKLEPTIQSEVSQKDKHKYSILTHIYEILKDGNNNPVCEAEKETQMYRTVFWTLWERARAG